MGTHELGMRRRTRRSSTDVRELESMLRACGLGDRRLKVRIDEGAGHNEAAWAARFPEALEFLYSVHADNS